MDDLKKLEDLRTGDLCRIGSSPDIHEVITTYRKHGVTLSATVRSQRDESQLRITNYTTQIHLIDEDRNDDRK